MIFEMEFENETLAQSYSAPDFVLKEITGDQEFSGFMLAMPGNV
jgi:CYTH domain-containing protein